MADAKKRFTGERLNVGDDDFGPDLSQHLAAYQFCLPEVAGKVVLDAGCGEGYGGRCIAGAASLVVGVDVSLDALVTAAVNRPENISFSCADLQRLSFADESFDVICCFQVLEHLRDPAILLQEVKRVLKASGLFMLTTPNKLTSFSENPHHVKEYRPDELQTLLRLFFPAVDLFGVFGSERVRRFQRSRRRYVERILRLDPLGVRHFLPQRIKVWACATLARAIRSRIKAEDGQSFMAIHPEDFTVAAQGIAEAQDLFAICRKCEGTPAKPCG
jgi:2-polyprenyl-3-methyl-5-hydroxy-6-metoxy-1,4-benzoquinol methylase